MLAIALKLCAHVHTGVGRVAVLVWPCILRKMVVYDSQGFGIFSPSILRGIFAGIGVALATAGHPLATPLLAGL